MGPLRQLNPMDRDYIRRPRARNEALNSELTAASAETTSTSASSPPSHRSALYLAAVAKALSRKLSLTDQVEADREGKSDQAILPAKKSFLEVASKAMRWRTTYTASSMSSGWSWGTAPK